MKEHLTIDIGASSGRVLCGRLDDGKLRMDLIHRFPNGYVKQGRHLVWDIDHLFEECRRGIDLAIDEDRQIVSIAIDTWGCDYVLIGEDGKRLSPAVSYRDSRTDGVSCPFDREELYRRTGIQHLSFNTIYQLAAQREEEPEIFQRAAALLMIPDYLAYRLTGNLHQEYTNATTTGMVDAKRRVWDMDIVRGLSIPEHLFMKLSQPGEVYGLYRGIPLVAAPTHDTASAVFGTPLDDSTAFLSSGTWSLLGAVVDGPILTREAMEENFSNEGGVGGTIRFLRNLMGTWMLQNLRKEWPGEVDFPTLSSFARENSAFPSIVDIEDERFLAPESMADEVKMACRDAGGKVPSTYGEVASCIYNSLAVGYSKALKRLERLTGKRFSKLAIVGGGSQDEYLSILTAEALGIIVTTGPVEATAVGNTLLQMLSFGEISSRKEMSRILSDSFRIKEYRSR